MSIGIDRNPMYPDVLLSTPFSMSALLSFRRVDSVFLSAIDMKDLIETLGNSAFDSLCSLLERTAVISQERANLTIRSLVLCSEYFPILEQSHIV